MTFDVSLFFYIQFDQNLGNEKDLFEGPHEDHHMCHRCKIP